MGKIRGRVKVSARRSSVKPKLSSNKGGFLTAKVAAIINKNRNGKGNT